jgi:hypothetical protein
MLSEPGDSYNEKQFVFTARLNDSLEEVIPVKVLKSQFKKKTGNNFLLMEGEPGWKRLAAGSSTVQDPLAVIGTQTTFYQNLSEPEENRQYVVKNDERLFGKLYPVKYYSTPGITEPGIRFSLLDKELGIAADTLVRNRNNRFNVTPGPFAGFTVGNKEYLLLSQQFANRYKGLLLISNGNDPGLNFTDLRVNDKNDYLLSKARYLPGQGILIPYIIKNEAGLVRIGVK